MKNILLISFIVLVLIAAGYLLIRRPVNENNDIVSYVVDVKNQDLRFYWKDEKGLALGNLGRLKTWLSSDNRELEFGMNGGMFKPDYSPLGLFIQDGSLMTPIDTSNATGNFYLKPNGVFYLTRNRIAEICRTEKFVNSDSILYATQSGPLLVIDGNIHAAFKQGSVNLQIRNGVGVLPDGKLIFAMTKKVINFYDFATYFKNLGCLNALYLDGFVSRMYLPKEQLLQTDGNLGVLIGVSTAN